MRVLLGISGGIAAYKTPELLRRLQKQNCEVGVALTPNATRFVSPLVFQTLADNVVMTDAFATESEGVGHIDLADWADVFIVAPATAQTVARLASGFADDPVSLSFLATQAPRAVFPAMNVNMWTAAATQRNVALLKEAGVLVPEPASGELACGWLGAGRLADLDEIVEATLFAGTPKPLQGRHVLITAGPTREAIDPIRYISNPSTGKMGFALARQAARMGASVELVSGPTDLRTPYGVRRTDVLSAEEMRDAVFNLCNRTVPDILIAAAAVGDYRPKTLRDRKIKKSEQMPAVDLERTPDVLAETVAKFQPLIRVGFAAETHNVLEYAREKLQKKQLTHIVANDVAQSHGGFGDEENHVWLLDSEGKATEFPLASKNTIAARILEEIRAAIK